MIQQIGQLYLLHTKNTTYGMGITPTGHIEHYYYGRKITVRDRGDQTADVFKEKFAFAAGNCNAYQTDTPNFTLENVCLEISSYGKGDIREPFIEVVHADGSSTSDFLFEQSVITKGKEAYKTLPGSYDESGEVEHLCMICKDASYDLTLELHYYVYEDCDVITRSACLKNRSKETIQLKRLMSMQLDFPENGFVVSTFNGEWGREMKRTDTVVRMGKFVNSSYNGSSSSRANPFFMIQKEHTTEDYGECYGCNLIYSGNHYEAVESTAYDKTRVVAGINPTGFCFELLPGADFEAPEAVMTYSNHGLNGMSQSMHEFVREHIVRGEWKKKARPVLLNSWEAAYFDINERRLLKLAKAGKEVGIELFVMDDGWFGKRNDDKSSLGDWFVNKDKLPNGVDGLCKKVNELGLEFGIWVEPEMISVDSELYRAHPDWAMDIPGKPHTEGRNQRILDLTRTDVQDNIIEQMSTLFGSANISYVKWDMNRTMSDIYSKALPPKRQGEVTHRYMMGFYRIMQTLTEQFPHILFEGCAAGGNRFDLGMLCYFPQIWASDNTDAVCRAEIQNGYSYGYPMSCVSAHVSAVPNHQTLRITPLESRFHVAMFGSFGYECNLCDMKKEELEEIQLQIAWYKGLRNLLQFGKFYRGRGPQSGDGQSGSTLMRSIGNITEWTCVSRDQTKAVGMIMQKLVSPNTHFECYKANGLRKDAEYHFYNQPKKLNVKNFGDLVNTISPIHIKQDSFTHHLISKFIKLDGEAEDYFAYGDTLMYHGVKLKQGFASNGFNEEVRHFQDFCSRMYFMEMVE